MLWYETCIFLDNFDSFWWQFCIDTCQYRSWKNYFEKNAFDWRFLVWFWASKNLSKFNGMKQLSRQFDISYDKNFLANFDHFWWQFCIDTCHYRSWNIIFEIFYVGLTHFSLLLSIRKLGQLVKMLWYETKKVWSFLITVLHRYMSIQMMKNLFFFHFTVFNVIFSMLVKSQKNC